MFKLAGTDIQRRVSASGLRRVITINDTSQFGCRKPNAPLLPPHDLLCPSSIQVMATPRHGEQRERERKVL